MCFDNVPQHYLQAKLIGKRIIKYTGNMLIR